MPNFSPTSPVLGDPLQLFPAQPRLRNVCLKVTSPGVCQSPPPPISLVLRVPRQCVSCNVSIMLSQCVAKPSPSSRKNVYLYSNLVCSIPEILVAEFVHPQYSQYFPQAVIALSASSASPSTKSRLSVLTLFFTSLCADVYAFCAATFAVLVWLLLIVRFLSFLICIFLIVSAEIQSFCCGFLLPSTSSHVVFTASLM